MPRFRTAIHSAVFLLAALASCAPEAPDLSGRFEGAGLTVELRAVGSGLEGAIAHGGRSFRARAAPDAAGLTGTFEDGTDRFEFRMVAMADGARLTSGGATYELRRLAPQNPLAGKSARSADPPAAQSTDARTVDPEAAPDPEQVRKMDALAAAPAFTKTYRHPAGVYFLHPDGWEVKVASEGAVSLQPVDPIRVGGEPAELLLVVGEQADGASAVDDARVLRLVEQFVTESFPTLRRDGSPQQSRAGAHDVLEVRWSADASGTAMRAGMHVVLLGGYALGAFTLAPKDRFEERSRTMREVVGTLGYEKPSADPRLVGSWRHTKTYSSGSFGSVTERYLTLAADGSCAESGKLMAGMEHTDSTGAVTGSSSADADGAERRGRWRMEGSELVLEWRDGGGQRWGVHVEGDSMLWKSGSSRMLWDRTR